MTHFKNLKSASPGFSFMEIMVAVIMLGLMMSAIFNLQNTTFGSVVDFSARLRNIFSLKNSFIRASQQRAEQKEEPPKGPSAEQPQEIKYSLEKINEKSELKKFENILIQKGIVQWQEGLIKRQEPMISFLYKAPEKKENEKK